MLGEVIGVLAWLNQLSDGLACLVVGMFCLGAVLQRGERCSARYVTVAAWITFALFWLSLVHYYGVESKSIVEGLASVLAVPAFVYVGWLLARGRDSLFVLSRAIAAMGVIFLPFELLVWLQRPLIETVTRQTEFLMGLLGYRVGEAYEVISGAAIGKAPYRNTFLFVDPTGHRLTYTIRIACTGIGSIAIVGGLIAAVRAPLDRKLRALAVSIPVIYGLNLLRNVFIAIAFGTQRLQVFPELVLSAFASTDLYLVSYFIADRILSQSLSVVALVTITWLVIRELPEVLTIVEDVLYVATGTEYDLQGAFDGADGPTEPTAGAD